jgi:hypothetical protein
MREGAVTASYHRTDGSNLTTRSTMIDSSKTMLTDITYSPGSSVKVMHTTLTSS